MTKNAKRPSPTRAIRAKCIDCCAGNKREVRMCALTSCPLHPFRFGKNPNRAGVGGSPAHKRDDAKPTDAARTKGGDGEAP